jgi:hypothetical protein
MSRQTVLDPVGVPRAPARPSPGPARAAVLALLTVSAYGFWWWFDLHRRLRALGQPAHPWRALAAVTVGWVGLLPPFRAVDAAARMVAGAQRSAGTRWTVQPRLAVACAAAGAVGLLGFLLVGAVWPDAGFVVGLVPPLAGMALIAYLQAGLRSADRAP